MSTPLTTFPQILEIENDLRYLTQTLTTTPCPPPSEHSKILKTYTHLLATHKIFKTTIAQTFSAKETSYTRSHTQFKNHKKFLHDLSIAWAAHDILTNTVTSLDAEVEEWHLTHPNPCVLHPTSQDMQRFLALIEERDIAARACENSDRLCADMTELAGEQRKELAVLEAEVEVFGGWLEVARGRACGFDVGVRRVERGMRRLFEGVGVGNGWEGGEGGLDRVVDGDALSDVGRRLGAMGLEG